jgi:hypothetical protein
MGGKGKGEGVVKGKYFQVSGAEFFSNILTLFP